MELRKLIGDGGDDYFQWEKEMVDVCSGLVLGVRRTKSEGDCWKWREELYTVKEACQLLLKGEEGDEDCDWARDVWNQLIPSNMSTLVWRLFHRRLPTKEN
jgi:hypothetical protein